VPVRLDVPVQPLGLLGGRHRCRQRPDRLPGEAPVVRQPGLVQFGVRAGQRLRVAPVQGDSLHRQQLLLQHLGDQPVS